MVKVTVIGPVVIREKFSIALASYRYFEVGGEMPEDIFPAR
jgi:hypothetical protein